MIRLTDYHVFFNSQEIRGMNVVSTLHDVFDVFIDIIPDTPHLDAFQKAFRFQ